MLCLLHGKRQGLTSLIAAIIAFVGRTMHDAKVLEIFSPCSSKATQIWWMGRALSIPVRAIFSRDRKARVIQSDISSTCVMHVWLCGGLEAGLAPFHSDLMHALHSILQCPSASSWSHSVFLSALLDSVGTPAPHTSRNGLDRLPCQRPDTHSAYAVARIGSLKFC